MSVTGPATDLTPEDALDGDPFDDDLAGRLDALAPRPVTRTTLALIGLVVLVAGFVGGILVQKNFGSTGGTTGNSQPNFPPAAAGAFPGGSATQPPSATTGTVKLVDGTTVYITLSNGDVATVKTSDRTSVTVTQKAAVKDLKVGQAVTVAGTTGADGIITATTVTAER